MSDEVLERTVGTYMATSQPQYGFGWQGGEPTLMGLEFFRKVTETQARFGRRGALVSNGLQTNGTLLDDEFARHLAAYNFLVGISIDGPAEVHDIHRRSAGGAGSHAAVMAGLEALKRNRVEHNVLTLVSSANVRRPAETYRYLRGLGVNFHQYIECVEFDADGRLMPFAVGPEEWGEFLCGIYDEWRDGDTRKVSVRCFDSILTMLVDGCANVCKLGEDCRQYLVVEHNGDVYPCDFFVEPDLKLGNVMTHTWDEMLESPVYRRFGEMKREWNDACEVCEFRSVCAGDCQKNRYYGRRDPRQVSVLCEGWKRFFRHALPGLRELSNEIVRDRELAAAEARRQRAQRYRADTGRNDPCPCGSGRKFKHCCGAV